MFSSNNSKSKLLDIGGSNFKGGYNNNNLGDYYDTPMSFTSPILKGGLARDGSADLFEPIQGQGSIKYPSPNPYMRNMASKSISSQLTPLKANQDNYSIARDKFNRSQIEDMRALVGENGAYLSKSKPRALSHLKTAQYGTSNTSQRIELNNMLTKKGSLVPLGTKTPNILKEGMSDFAWQSLSNAQLPQIGRQARGNLDQSFKLPPSGPSGALFLQKKLSVDQEGSINEALKKIARAGEDFSNMRDYARALITRFDRDFDGVITFQELCDGLDQFDIDLSLKDKMSLMKKLDVDADGEITEAELARALQTVDAEIINESVATALKKISAGSERYPNMRDYVRDLVRKFDHNSDGLISINELSEGLSKIHIYLNQREVQGLMDKIDLDRDGEVSAEELLTAINSVGSGFSSSQLKNSVDWVIRKLVSDGSSFSSLKDYARHLIRKFDKDSDGIISFQELCEGLAKLSIFISSQEKQALMECLDIDRDGQITEAEMFRVLSQGSPSGAATSNAGHDAIAEATIRKIAAGASKFSSLNEYVRDLVRRFDRNSDGLLSIGELTDGLKKIGISLNSLEVQALMKRLDLNRDGEVSADEILTVLGGSAQSSSIEKVIQKLQDGGKSFSSMKDYCKHLIKKFDRDNDGIITFTELCDGLQKLNIMVAGTDKRALMERLDLDRDGKITEHELYRVISGTVSEDLIEQTVKKIAAGAKKFNSMADYVKDLVRKFDRNSDGFLSMQELTDGLAKIGIFLTQKEIQALMNKLDLNRDGELSADEILSVLSQNGGSSSVGQLNTSVDRLVDRLAAGAKGFPSMKDYARSLIKKFDRDSDGIISFNELCDGLTKMSINVSQSDKKGLMDLLDIDRDGKITENELFRVLSGEASQEIVEQTLRKIASGAKSFSSMAEYVRDLVRKFDRNSDGLLSIQELTDGLRKIGIALTNKEIQALMTKLDLNRDGEVSAEEILKTLSSFGSGFAVLSSSSSTTLDSVISKMVQSGKSFPSLKDYAKHLIRKWDKDSDGIITFSELCDGIYKLNIMISQQDKRGLMDLLDIDRDGKITETELFRVLSGGAAPEIIDQTLRKISGGAQGYSNLGDYTRDLVRKFDKNGDGLISIHELADGLASLGIFLTQKEQQALMSKLDLDRDGEVSAQEIQSVLQKVSTSAVSSTGVDAIIKRLVQDGKSYPSLREYASHLIRKFDRDSDGIITFQELCDGLGKLSIFVTQHDKKALMERLDVDRDGRITETEIYKALSGSSSDKGGSYGSTLVAENTLRKIAAGAKSYPTMNEYVRDLVRKFDRNSDGLLSMQELTTGLTKIGVVLTNTEVQALMNKLDLNRDGEVSADELLSVLKKYDTKKPNTSVDKVIKKLAEGSSKFPSMRDYARSLIKQFDRDSDGIITFTELCDGLLKLKIVVTQLEKQGLMERLDIDRDGKITETEMHRVLLSVDNSSNQVANNAADQTIKKIASGASKFGGSLSEYTKDLVKRFDRDSDGLLTIQELTDGLKKIGISLNQRETEVLMNKFDLNRDGEVSADEILKVLQGGNATGPSIDHIILKLAAQGNSFPSMKDYAKSLIRKFDRDSDGIITFQELCDGLVKMNFNISISEKQALMERLDIDRDGRITEKEIYRVLQNAESPHRRLGGLGSIIENTLKKIASGADDTNNMRDYAKKLIRKFDKNSDGLISIAELTQGLKTMNIYLTQEERDALMQKLDLDRNGEISDQELYQALSTVSTSDLLVHARDAADIALKKLAAGAEEYSNMHEYVNVLIRNFDNDQDGAITFTELCEGVKRMNIFLSLKERQALMKQLDLDSNGSLSADELYSVLQRVDTKLSKKDLQSSIENALRKIASGAEEYSNLRDYVTVLFKNFDVNYDGLISFEELVDGLRTLNINLTSQEKAGLMKRFDFNRDGEISEDEVFRVLAPYDYRSVGAAAKSFSPIKSLSLGSSMKTLDYSPSYASTAPINVKSIIDKIKRNASKYPSLDSFVTALMNRYDSDGDGLINQSELQRGLENDGIKLTKTELLAFMNQIDIDRDGEVSKDEIYQALTSDGSRIATIAIGSGSTDTILKRIKVSADRFKSLEDFCRFVFNKFDADRSGSLSFNELSNGLEELGINVGISERMELMRTLDVDGDGEVGFMEFYNGLSGFSGNVNLDNIMAKITNGADQYPSIESYVGTLFRRFDINRDGAVSYQELRDGLRSMKVALSDNEVRALFNRLDADHDGSVTSEELFVAISAASGSRGTGIGGYSSTASSQMNSILTRISQGAEKARTIEDFVIAIFRRFDINQDGAVSQSELRDGLLSMTVRLEDSELRTLFNRLDADHDGSVTNYELYQAIFQALESQSKFSSHKFTSVDTVMWMIKKAGEKYPTLREYADFLMRKLDIDNDGLVAFEELGKGLKSIEVKATDQEHLALMRLLDKDRDGGISKFELYNALEQEFGSTKALNSTQPGYAVDSILNQIRKKIDPYKSQGEQILNLMRIFDKDQDGLISYNELVDGIRVLGVKATRGDVMDLMHRIDIDKDGIVTQMELSKALGLYSGSVIGGGAQSPSKLTYKSSYK